MAFRCRHGRRPRCRVFGVVGAIRCWDSSGRLPRFRSRHRNPSNLSGGNRRRQHGQPQQQPGSFCGFGNGCFHVGPCPVRQAAHRSGVHHGVGRPRGRFRRRASARIFTGRGRNPRDDHRAPDHSGLHLRACPDHRGHNDDHPTDQLRVGVDGRSEHLHRPQNGSRDGQAVAFPRPGRNRDPVRGRRRGSVGQTRHGPSRGPGPVDNQVGGRVRDNRIKRHRAFHRGHHRAGGPWIPADRKGRVRGDGVRPHLSKVPNAGRMQSRAVLARVRSGQRCVAIHRDTQQPGDHWLPVHL